MAFWHQCHKGAIRKVYKKTLIYISLEHSSARYKGRIQNGQNASITFLSQRHKKLATTLLMYLLSSL